MGSIQAWHVWMILGILFTIIEIIDPAFFFLSLAVGAIVTGLFSLAPFVGSSVAIQILIFVLFSFVAFLSMRKLGKKVLKNPGGATNVQALIGKTGLVTKTIESDSKGYVKIGGEEWSAITEDNSIIEQGSKIKVLSIDGNKLIVSKAE